MNHVVSTAFTFSIKEKMASGQMIKVGSPTNKTSNRIPMMAAGKENIYKLLMTCKFPLNFIFKLFQRHVGEHVFFNL